MYIYLSPMIISSLGAKIHLCFVLRCHVIFVDRINMCYIFLHDKIYNTYITHSTGVPSINIKGI